MRPRLLLAVLLVCLTAAAPGAALAAAPAPGHVWVIVLENEDAGTTFSAASQAPYLARTLTAQGAFVPGYYGISHNSLPNYLAMVSGQAPTTETQADCPVFSDVLPGVPAPNGQVLGQGCVYPRSVRTIGDQLQARRLTWKGYMEDMGDDPVRDNGTACAHPAIGTTDRTQQASATDQYATRHNPFVYFHSVIDDDASCRAHDVPLRGLTADLGAVSTTPNLSFITPDLCHDGHDETCADGGPGGLPAADAFLREWVPRITSSPAYRRDGLLVITFDEAGSDATACCGEVSGPNTPLAGIYGPGGGRTGAVLLSPAIRPGTVSSRQYNHFSLLRSLEDGFGVPRLGYAAAPGVQSFGADIFTAARRK